MKRLLLLTPLLFLNVVLFAQYRGTRQNVAIGTTEDYVTNTPGNSASNSRLIGRYKDSTNYELYYANFRISTYGSARNDGVPSNILWTDANGNFKKSSLPSWITTEADPTVSSYVKGITSTYFNNGNTAFSWGNHASAGYLTTALAASTYQPLLGFTPYNSTNPSGYISGINSAQVISALGFTPYSNSNPSGYISGINSGNVVTALGFTPYNATNPAGYISSINSSQVTTALGYSPVNPNGTSLQYIAGDGSKISFPSIPAAQVQSDWNAVTGLGVILNKPTLALTTFPVLSTKTANYTVLSGDWGASGMLTIPVDATSGNITITLPTITGLAGKVINIKRLDGTANTITISGNGVNIDGTATVSLPIQWSNLQILASTQYLTL